MAGYSGKAVYQKLGLQPTHRLKVLQSPQDYAALVGLGKVTFTDAHHDLDVIHVFIYTVEDLWTLLPGLPKEIKPSGMIWVSWPKKKSPLFSGITEDHIREAALGMDLVDVKVCAINDTWSALKLVIPLTRRGMY